MVFEQNTNTHRSHNIFDESLVNISKLHDRNSPLYIDVSITGTTYTTLWLMHKVCVHLRDAWTYCAPMNQPIQVLFTTPENGKAL